MSTLKKLLLIAGTPCCAFTYYIDPSCGQHSVDIPTVMTDVKTLATSGRTGISDTSQDARGHYDLYYNQLFKETHGHSPITENTLDTFFKNIQQLQPSQHNNRASSNIRIYCDEDARFGPRDSNGERRDPVNRIIMPAGTQGCADDGTEAETYRTEFPNGPAGEASPRATITICKAIFGYKHTTEDYFSTLSNSVDSSGKITGDDNEMDKVNKIISRVLFHEFTHFNGMGTDSIKYTSGSGGHGEAMYWGPYMGEDESVIGLNKDQAIKNAESYAFFALLCRALSLGWFLPGTNLRYGELAQLPTQ